MWVIQELCLVLGPSGYAHEKGPSHTLTGAMASQLTCVAAGMEGFALASMNFSSWLSQVLLSTTVSAGTPFKWVRISAAEWPWACEAALLNNKLGPGCTPGSFGGQGAGEAAQLCFQHTWFCYQLAVTQGVVMQN